MGTSAKFSPGSGTGNRSLSAATTGTGTAISFHDCRQVSWSTTYPGTAPTAGTVLIEQSPDASFAGTWNQLASIDCSQLGGNGWLWHVSRPDRLCPRAVYRKRGSANHS